MPFVPKAHVFALGGAGTIRRSDLPSTPEHASSADAEGPIVYILSPTDNTDIGYVVIGRRNRMRLLIPAEKLVTAYYGSFCENPARIWAR